MPDCKSEPTQPPRAAGEDAVSEVIGFIMTFAIVATLLLVAMLSFNDAQGRAADRVAEIQANSAAQRVSAAAVDLALLVQPGSTTSTIFLAVELPTNIVGGNYLVKLCQEPAAPPDPLNPMAHCGEDGDWCDDNPCPFVRVDAGGARPQRQSTFLTAGALFCTTPGDFIVNGGTVFVTWNGSCIGLSNTAV